jgi:hypothetical protein
MLRSLRQLYGKKLGASDGDIGHVRDFYFNDQQWAIRYVVADTGSWLSGRLVLMPKSKRKSKKQQNREKRDFAETASAVFQQAMGIKQPRARHPAQRHSRSGRSR